MCFPVKMLWENESGMRASEFPESIIMCVALQT